MRHMSQPYTQKKQNNIASIKTESISKQFTSNNGGELLVLDNISLEVSSGEILAIVGRSGSGKSTFLNIISGLDKPTSGTITINGSIGYVPQKDLLLPWRTVMENILLPIEIQNLNSVPYVEKARSLLQKNGLGQFERSYPSEISGGMRQKVSLIRTMIQNSDILLFDESFSALDFDARLNLLKDVRSYIVFSMKSGVFITHNIEEAIALADKLIVFSDRPAKIIFESKIRIAEKYRDPVNVRKSKDFQELFEKVWKMLSE